jgi:hypothetical protein
MKRRLALLFVCSFLITACGPATPSVNEQISIAVQQTVAAIPTFTPYPPPVILSTSTPVSLAGLYCEYQFCIGHPADMAFFDVSAQRNPTAPSTASQGLLAAYNAKLFIQFVWQDAPSTTDPQFMLDLILDTKVDTRNGNLDPLLIGNLNVIYIPITTTASPVLPNGGIAAWICGGRAFAWKAYTPQPDLPKTLLIEALQNFRCSNNN